MAYIKEPILRMRVEHTRTTSSMRAFGAWTGVSSDIVDGAIDSIRSGSATALLGSGAQGSGKDTIITGVFSYLNIAGVQCRVAHAIRREMQRIIDIIHASDRPESAVVEIAGTLEVSAATAALYVELFFERSRQGADSIDVFERTEQMRRALQWHGSEARVDQVGYWVKRAYQDVLPHLAAGRNVYLTDGRFPGEVDAGRTAGVYCARLWVPEATRVARIMQRDGFQPSGSSLHHPGELALDGYWGLDVELDNTGDMQATIQVLADLLIEHQERLARID